MIGIGIFGQHMTPLKNLVIQKFILARLGLTGLIIYCQKFLHFANVRLKLDQWLIKFESFNAVSGNKHKCEPLALIFNKLNFELLTSIKYR